MNHIIDEYAGVIIGLIVSYSMINIFGNIFTGVIRIYIRRSSNRNVCSGGCHDNDWNVYVCVQKYTFRCDRFMPWIADKGGINEGDN